MQIGLIDANLYVPCLYTSSDKLFAWTNEVDT